MPVDTVDTLLLIYLINMILKINFYLSSYYEQEYCLYKHVYHYLTNVVIIC